MNTQSGKSDKSESQKVRKFSDFLTCLTWPTGGLRGLMVVPLGSLWGPLPSPWGAHRKLALGVLTCYVVFLPTVAVHRVGGYSGPKIVGARVARVLCVFGSGSGYVSGLGTRMISGWYMT